MKRLLIFLLLITGLTAMAQGTIPSYPGIKLTKLSNGVKQDSVLVVNGLSKSVKQLPTSAIKGTTNLDYTASPIGGTVFSSTGNDAVLPLASSTNAGLQSPADKAKMDGLDLALSVLYQPLENQRVSTTNSPSFAGLQINPVGSTPMKLGNFSFINEWAGQFKWNDNEVFRINSGTVNVDFAGKVAAGVDGFATGSTLLKGYVNVIGGSSPSTYLYGYDGIQFDNRAFYNGPTTFSFNGIEKARITADGKFLIGTQINNGEDIFQAVGSGLFKGTSSNLRLWNDTGGYSNISSDGVNKGTIIWGSYGGNLTKVASIYGYGPGVYEPALFMENHPQYPTTKSNKLAFGSGKYIYRDNTYDLRIESAQNVRIANLNDGHTSAGYDLLFESTNVGSFYAGSLHYKSRSTKEGAAGTFIERFTAGLNGNFGIYNTNPQYEWDVTGTGRFSNLIISSPPATSAGTYDILTRNRSTGVVENIADVRPYKVYTALVSQDVINAPTAIVLENTIGSIAWQYSSTGLYTATLTGAFTLDKTVVLCTGQMTGAIGTIVRGSRTDNNTVTIRTTDSATNVDGQLNKATIEIRVYN